MKTTGTSSVNWPAEVVVGVDVDFLPTEQAAALEFHQALFDDFAEMATLARVNQDLAGVRHGRECSRFGAIFNRAKCKEE